MIGGVQAPRCCNGALQYGGYSFKHNAIQRNWVQHGDTTLFVTFFPIGSSLLQTPQL